MGVPTARSRVFLLPVKDLDKPHTLLDKAPGCQADLAKRPGVLLVQAVKPSGCFALLLKAQDFRDLGLHVKSQLIRFDARSHRCILGVLHGPQTIQLAQKRKFSGLFLLKDLRPRGGERQWVFRVDIQPDAGMFRTEVTRTVRPGSSTAGVGWLPQDHKLRELVAE